MRDFCSSLDIDNYFVEGRGIVCGNVYLKFLLLEGWWGRIVRSKFEL